MLPTDLVNHKSISQEPCFASRPGGEASTVLQVALLAKQAFSRREPSSCQSWDDPLLSLLEVLRPREEGRSTLLSLNWEAAGDDEAALLSLLEVLRPREEGRSTLLSLNWEAAGDDEAALLSLLEVLRPREEGRSTLLSLNWEAAGDDEAALLSLLEVLRPREEGRSTLLSLNWEAAADDDAALLSLLAGVLLCHDVVAAHAQCKDEASEYTRFERHGNADTPELKSVPEWLEEKLAKTLRKNIKMLKNDTKFQAQTERANFCSFQLRMSKVLKLKQIPRSSSPRTCGSKPPTDIFPAAERPDNMMQKRLMTKPRRGRAKEHRVIPANDPNVPNTNSWGKTHEGQNTKPRNQKSTSNQPSHGCIKYRHK